MHWKSGKFNSIYGMCVTNEIRENVDFDNFEWKEVPLSNEEILEKLQKQKDYPFLSYSYGVWVTAYARYNLLSNLVKLDNKVIYADTDSLKLEEGFDKSVIDEYNNEVLNKIKRASEDLGLDIKKYSPEDKDGKEHTIGLFDFDGFYKEFKTLGAKKYAYLDKDGQIHITVSGVPKSGAKALKSLEDFRNDFVFEYKDTGKNLIVYNDEQEEFILTDYNGVKEKQTDRFGICMVPTTYALGISEEYADLISDESSKHAKFLE